MQRKAAIAALAFAVAAVVITAAAAVAVQQRYAAFRPLDHPFLTGIAASVVAALALRTRIREETRRLLAQAGAGALGLAAITTGALVTAATLNGPHDPRVLATGPDVQVVAWRVPAVGVEHLQLRLRSRAGLLSRDGAADLACVIDPAAGLVNSWTLGTATLDGADTLLVRTTDGQQWRVRFDPATLRPTDPPADRCADYRAQTG
jgi:hypothetical protein